MAISFTFPIKTLYAFLIPPVCATCPSLLILLKPDHSNMWSDVQIMKTLTILFSPFSCYLIPLWPMYQPQHPILIHHLPMLFPKYRGQRFTSIPNKGLEFNQECQPRWLVSWLEIQTHYLPNGSRKHSSHSVIWTIWGEKWSGLPGNL